MCFTLEENLTKRGTHHESFQILKHVGEFTGAKMMEKPNPLQLCK